MAMTEMLPLTEPISGIQTHAEDNITVSSANNFYVNCGFKPKEILVSFRFLLSGTTYYRVAHCADTSARQFEQTDMSTGVKRTITFDEGGWGISDVDSNGFTMWNYNNTPYEAVCALAVG